MRRKWKHREKREKVIEDEQEDEQVSESDSDHEYGAAVTAVDEGI